MNRLVVVLSLAIIILSVVSGFLFYQLNAVQNVNSELRSQNADIQAQLNEQQIQNDELENQITELQNQNSELQNQIDELQNQTDELVGQITELQNQNNQLITQTIELQNQSDKLQNQNDKLNGQVAELQNQSSDLQAQIAELQSQSDELQNQISELETQLYDFTHPVRITGVKLSSPYAFHLVTMVRNANVTVENFGINDVEGLILTTKHSSVQGPPYSPEPPYSLDVLHSGEKIDVNCRVYMLVGHSGTATFTLTLGNVTIDEYIIPNVSS